MGRRGGNKAGRVWGQVGRLSGRWPLGPCDWIGQRRRRERPPQRKDVSFTVVIVQLVCGVFGVSLCGHGSLPVRQVIGHLRGWGTTSWVLRGKCSGHMMCLCRYRTTKDITLPFRVIPLVRLSSQNHMEIKVCFSVTLTLTPHHHSPSLITTHPPLSPFSLYPLLR